MTWCRKFDARFPVWSSEQDLPVRSIYVASDDDLDIDGNPVDGAFVCNACGAVFDSELIALQHLQDNHNRYDDFDGDWTTLTDEDLV
jgi:hypothetical protein